MEKNINNLPYGDIVYHLLSSIFEGLNFCIVNNDSLSIDFPLDNNNKINIGNEDEQLANFYQWITKKYPSNQGENIHLIEGFQKKIYPPRLSKLTINAYREAQKQDKNLLPSPLYILYQALSVPNYPQSYAYSTAVCRTLLFKRFKLHPYNSKLHPNWNIFKSEDISDSVDKIRRYIKINDNWIYSEREQVSLMVSHFLAMKGIVRLRFDKKNYINDMKEYLLSSDIHCIDKNKNKYEFRLSDDFDNINDAPELINELMGIPLPIRGAETIFFGGLKTESKSGSLVVSLSGKAGTGKTSLALALAANLSPFKSFCLYLSFEEDSEDLINRLLSITPNYLKRLSIFNNNNTDWFKAVNFDFLDDENLLKSFSDNYIDEIKKLIRTEILAEDSLPSICPLIVVFDSINYLLENHKEKLNYSELEKFIKRCKDLGVIVILISAEGLPLESRMDYLVDMVINLHYKETDNLDNKPIRVLEVIKTRYQISRPGSHLFHLSGSSGFRISPQIPSQIDKKENSKRNMAQRDMIINTLNIISENSKNAQYDNFLDLYQNSHILIHGTGSSGKAGLALKILLTPPTISTDKKNFELFKQGKYIFKKDEYKRKVLIVSFLYPEIYYEGIKKSLSDLNISKFYKGLLEPELHYKIFYPGFLTAEDFIAKISRELDSAIQSGEPYTGILMDGLHNASLQFKYLHSKDMVWPVLYSMFYRYKITIVTTFTNFNLNIAESTVNQKDQSILLQGHVPLLHVLVHATDFYLLLNEKGKESNEEIVDEKTVFLLEAKSAIGQGINKSKKRYWDREKYILSSDESQDRLPFYQ